MAGDEIIVKSQYVDIQHFTYIRVGKFYLPQNMQITNYQSFNKQLYGPFIIQQTEKPFNLNNAHIINMSSINDKHVPELMFFVPKNAHLVTFFFF